MVRRHTLIVVGLVMLTLFVGGIAHAEPVTIKYFGHTFDPTNNLVKQMIPEFEKENPDIKVEYEYVSGTQMEEKLLTELAAGVGPDLWHVRDRSFLTFQSVGAMAPVIPSAFGLNTSAEVAALYDEGTTTAYTVDGLLYGIPKEHNIITLFYRMDHFEEVGLDPNAPPTTWDELVEYGKKLTKRDAKGRLLRAGFEWPDHSSGKLTRFAALLYQAGGDFFSEDMSESIINSPAGLKAAQTWTAPIEAGICDPAFVLADDFANGRVSMTTSGPYFPSDIATNYPHLEYGKHYAAARYPHIADGEEAAIFTGWAWVVNSVSKNQEAAWKFIDFMSRQPDRWLANTGFIQPRKGLLDTEVAQGIEHLDLFMEMNSIVRFMPRTPIYVEMHTPFADMIDRVSLDGMDHQEALDALKVELDELLRIRGLR